MPDRNNKSKKLTGNDVRLQKRFLRIDSFDDYYDHLYEFRFLKETPDVFIHQMKLMEGDGKRTHREKDDLIAKKKRRITKELKKRMEELCTEMKSSGFWDTQALENSPEKVLFRYRYPEGRRAAVINEVARGCASEISENDGIISAEISGEHYRELAVMAFRWHAFDDPGDQGGIRDISGRAGTGDGKKLPAEIRNYQADSFLRTVCYPAQMDGLIASLSVYTKDYRSMRSMKNLRARKLADAFLEKLYEKRAAVWQQLLIEEKESGKWVSEEKAFRITARHFTDAVYQYKPVWLHGQSLDIFIPSLAAAIEYQGLQHYQPVDFFGGDEGYYDNRKRDAKKRMLCERKGIRLIYWRYDEPLTDKWFEENIMPLITEK
ncbi:MAG: hypothetical protein SOV71_07905 [Anaerovoracaceae bacterium]|nr:hypothetical protein [Bacillota bacterium]MDY2671453.1 hypothetical protein [Anaerovoracaceae bacterium]